MVSERAFNENFNRAPRTARPGERQERERVQIKLKAYEKAATGRARLSDIQERIWFQINQILPEESPETEAFNKQYNGVCELREKLTAAQKTRKNLDSHTQSFNWGMYALAGTEIEIFKSIESGFEDAIKVEEAVVLQLMQQRRDIEADYVDRISVDTKRMTQEEKEATALKKLEYKKIMLKDIKALQIKQTRLGKLEELRIGLSKVKSHRRILDNFCRDNNPLESGLSNKIVNEIAGKVIKEKKNEDD